MTHEERIRQLAYSIWEAEGRPEGQQQQHWDRATKIVAAEQAAGYDAELEEVGETQQEAPILENDLPLEEDERGIEENRLPLDDPETAALETETFSQEQAPPNPATPKKTSKPRTARKPTEASKKEASAAKKPASKAKQAPKRDHHD